MSFKKANYKKELIDAQSALLNVLEDYKKDSENILNSRKAVLNILGDLEIAKDHLLIEKERAEKSVQDLQRFKMAVENAYDKITFSDPDAIIIYVNKASEKITGYTPEEVIGKKSGELWGNIMPESFYKELWKTIKVDKKVFVGELSNKRKNGQSYNSLVNISPVLDENQNILFFVGIERDITKEKEIDKAKTELVSLASHQLLTPLSIVSWYVEMLLAGDAGEITSEQKKYLKEIYSGNKRMIDLVNSLLGVSRMELGTFVTNPVATDFVVLIKSVYEEQKLIIDEKEINLELFFEENIPIIQADPKYLQMLVQNILSNAIKYTKANGNIKIKLKKDTEKDFLLLEITDTGIGIPEKEKDKIFTKLFRARNVLENENIEGTGLGLYIVKSIVEHSGGKVWFESIENVGTSFFVRLPI